MSEIKLCENDSNRIQENRLLKGISMILDKFVNEIKFLDIEFSIFYSQKIPIISIENYLIRIMRYTKCSEQCLIIALIYIDRVQELNKELQINRQSVHRFIIIAIVLAIKYHEDDIYKNEYYAKVGGITMEQLNDMEIEFLQLLDYQLFVQKNVYYKYQKQIYQIYRN